MGYLAKGVSCLNLSLVIAHDHTKTNVGRYCSRRVEATSTLLIAQLNTEIVTRRRIVTAFLIQSRLYAFSSPKIYVYHQISLISYR